MYAVTINNVQINEEKLCTDSESKTSTWTLIVEFYSQNIILILSSQNPNFLYMIDEKVKCTLWPNFNTMLIQLRRKFFNHSLTHLFGPEKKKTNFLCNN